MIDLANEIKKTSVMAGELAVCWLGQAGFLLWDSTGTELVLDPYLSNCGEELRGFKRITPMLLSADELTPRYYVTTHTHFDHLDPVAVKAVAKNSPQTLFLGPDSCLTAFSELNISPERYAKLDVGESYRDDFVAIHAIQADHGDMIPDAIGVVVELGGHTIYFSGDTAFHEEIFLAAAAFHPELCAISVNGQFGNLDPSAGAKASRLTGCRYATACHCWTFLEHRGDPWLFYSELEAGSDAKPLIFRHGEIMILSAAGEFYKPKGSIL